MQSILKSNDLPDTNRGFRKPNQRKSYRASKDQRTNRMHYKSSHPTRPHPHVEAVSTHIRP